MKTRVLERHLRPGPVDQVEVSLVMPCLNEAETLASCIRKAQAVIEEHCLSAEIVIADNGSTDGSDSIARDLGVRVVSVEQKGYGNAVRAGVRAAHGTFIVVADTDGSHDLTTIYPFVEKLRAGYDLVMGNRFKGGIEPGSMPWLHRWIGNPILTRLGKLFFGSPVGDFHCGLRGFTKKAYYRLDLYTTGFEFCTEMVIRASLNRLRIAELPTVQYKAGRSRPPHLHTWRDGWLNLRFMLLFSPRWLFLIPGAVLLTAGLGVFLWLLVGPGQTWSTALQLQTLTTSGFLCLVGYQLIVFAAFTKIFAVLQGLHPPHEQLSRLLRHITLEVGVLAGLAAALLGLVALIATLAGWTIAGQPGPMATMRQAIPSAMLLALGIQTTFVSFFLSVLGVGVNVKGAGGIFIHQALNKQAYQLRQPSIAVTPSP
jgi:glycosyltransferase involved in cell wall biosynthesis